MVNIGSGERLSAVPADANQTDPGGVYVRSAAIGKPAERAHTCLQSMYSTLIGRRIRDPVRKLLAE